MVTVDGILSAIQPIKDPEMGFSIVDMGLIYDIIIGSENEVTVEMTLTSPMCPMGPQIIAAVKDVASNVKDVKKVDIALVWNPPWDPRTHANDDVQAMMGIWF